MLRRRRSRCRRRPERHDADRRDRRDPRTPTQPRSARGSGASAPVVAPPGGRRRRRYLGATDHRRLFRAASRARPGRLRAPRDQLVHRREPVVRALRHRPLDRHAASRGGQSGRRSSTLGGGSLDVPERDATKFSPWKGTRRSGARRARRRASRRRCARRPAGRGGLLGRDVLARAEHGAGDRHALDDRASARSRSRSPSPGRPRSAGRSAASRPGGSLPARERTRARGHLQGEHGASRTGSGAAP